MESNNKIIGWYRKLIRPFFSEHEPEKLAELTRMPGGSRRFNSTLLSICPFVSWAVAALAKARSLTRWCSVPTAIFLPVVSVH